MKKLNLFLILLISTQILWAQKTIELKKWMITSRQKITMPAFADVKSVDGKTFKVSDLLSKTQVDFTSKSLSWTNIEIAADSIVLSQNVENDLLVLQSYISVDRWMKGSLNLNLNAAYELYLDNELIKTNSSSDISSNKIELELQTGNHQISIKVLSSKDIMKLVANFDYSQGRLLQV